MTISRTQTLSAFLKRSEWAAWSRTPLAGDASARRYERLFSPARDVSVVLMDAGQGADLAPFCDVAGHLTHLGLSAPRILGQDRDNGILVLEDLGDDLFARVLKAAPEREEALYRAAVDVLVTLHATPPTLPLPRFAPPLDAEFIALAHGWYPPGAAGVVPASATRFRELMNRALVAHAGEPDVIILRDYHAENLIWLPDRPGARNVGLLDFQDALLGHRSYDLVSLLEDARRDVTPGLRARMLAHYVARTGCDPEAFEREAAVLAAQRNLRILGVFARLCLHFGKTHYVDLIPRVWDHLMQDLSHDALADLRDCVLSDLPAPTPGHLEEMKSRCATLSMP